MSDFRFRAAAPDGRIVRGQLVAGDSHGAGALLLDRGLVPVRIELVGDATPRRPATSRRLAVVFRSLASLVAGGVPLDRALRATAQVASGELRGVIEGADARLRAGCGLADALEASRRVPTLAIGMIRAGERAGGLPAALEQVALHLENDARLAAQLRDALAYPVLLLCLGGASVVIVVAVVLPRFAAMLSDAGGTLPASTRLLLSLSGLSSRYGLVGLVVALPLAVAAAGWLRSAEGVLRQDRMLLTVPVLGRVRHEIATARFCQALGSMLRAGMPLPVAIGSAAEAGGDRAVGERLGRVRDRVVRGEPFARSVAAESALSPAAVQLLEVGEQGGRVAELSARAAQLTAQDAERGVRRFVALLEPALIVGFGGGIALVAAALLQAVYSLRPGAP